MKSKKGLTLVELLVVIALISVLMLLVVPNVLKHYNNGKKNAFYDEIINLYSSSYSTYLLRSGEGDYRKKFCVGQDSETSTFNPLEIASKKNLWYDIDINDDGDVIGFKAMNEDYYIELSSTEVIKKKNLKNAIVENNSNNSILCSNNVGTSISLVEAIKRDNPTISTRTDFSVTNVANTTGTIYSTDSTEDGSTVYYYSGNTTNNWVLFGGFYWRIIRTNEDGSIRLLYSGTSSDTTSGYISYSKFNSDYDDPMYVGYMYGASGSLANNRANTNDSTIKQTIDTWYENNLLTDYDKYISKTAIYCNDRSIGSGTYNTGNTAFDYGAYTRLYTNKTPTYKCGGNTSGGLFESTQAVEDKFSASTTSGGNGQLQYPIALMTADELSYAGGVYDLNLSSPYAWYYTNSVGGSITGSTVWWTMTPNGWFGPYSNILGVIGDSDLGRWDYIYTDDFQLVRPTLSLKSCNLISKGDGTASNPYEISYGEACAE